MGWTPGMLVMDSASELNSEAFLSCLQQHGIKSQTIARDAHWQNSRSERHGQILQEILRKMDSEASIDTHEKMKQALYHATYTKNQWCRHRGFAPEMLVFGKMSRVPGTVSSDDQMSSHMLAESETPEGERFRADLAARERARRAFASVDNRQVMRRALIHRSRPPRDVFAPHDWIMVWRRKGEANGNWIGPMRVVMQESSIR